MAMTKTRVRRQSTLTFLAKQLVAVDQELGLLRRKAPAGGAAAATEAQRLRSLEVRRLALVQAMRQFDPELDLAGIAGASEAVGGARAASEEVADGGSHG